MSRSHQTPPSDTSGLRLYGWALGRAWRRRALLLALGGVLVIKIALDLARPWPAVVVIDYVLGGKPLPQPWAEWTAALPGEGTIGLTAVCAVAAVLVFLLGWLASLALDYARVTLGQRLTYDLAGETFDKLQRLAWHTQQREATGDRIRRVTHDCGCVAVIVRDAFLPLCTAVGMLAAMFAILWRLNATLTLLSLAVAPAMMAVFYGYARRMMDLSYAQQNVEARIYSEVEQSLARLQTIQAFGLESDRQRRLQKAHRDTIAATLRLTQVQMHFKWWMGAVLALGTAALLWVGGRQALAGQASVGEIIAFLSYLGMLYTPLQDIMYQNLILQTAAGSARRVREILHMPEAVPEQPNAPVLMCRRGDVRLERVTFGYEPGSTVLHAVNLQLEPGQMVALMGRSGAGKSTLAGLLPRFYDPWEGRVLIDGQDVRQVRLRSLRRHVAVVLQEPFLFPMSVAENIAYGRPDASFDEIRTVARVTQAHEFIAALPHGYDTVLEEAGVDLSVGQRQRLALARALLCAAPILVLDEPTSALDPETEARVMSALREYARGRTILLIAHRLSTVRLADRIVVLDAGRVVEELSPEDLPRTPH